MAKPLIVVAGAGGFIGGHLVKRLLGEGRAAVRAVDVKPLQEWFQPDPHAENLRLDLSLRDACNKVVRGASEVYNFAADMGGMGFIETNKARCMLSVLINTHLLLASRDRGVGRFFFASSACVYSAAKQETIAVDAGLREEDACPAQPEDGYGWEKLFSERMCRHFTEDFGLETRVARYHNIYGPHGAWDGGREKAPAAICRKVIRAIRSGELSIEIWGDGAQRRSFTAIDDCIEGTVRLMASDVPEPLNVGSDQAVSIDELVTVAERIGGTTLERRYKLDAPLGVRGRNSNNDRVQALIGWRPRVTIEEGLRGTYAWIEGEIAAGRQSSERRAPAALGDAGW